VLEMVRFKMDRKFDAHRPHGRHISITAILSKLVIYPSERTVPRGDELDHR
jgi:hypothetical protein